MCHESSGAALKETIGIGKGTVTLDDFLKADAIFVVGQNPGTNHPRMLRSLEVAKEHGAKIISVNPLPEVGNAFEPPKEHGCDTVKCIQAMHRGQIKVFFALGGNFLSATPDTELTAEALSRCRLTAHVSTKLNRAHLVTGRQALILPCLGRSEIDQRATGNQFVTVEDSMGIINPSRGTLAPASEHLLSEPAIVARLAETVLGERSKLPWRQWADDYNLIRDEIEQIIPGFEKFNSRISRGVFYLPNSPRDERKFPTRTGKANFTINQIERPPVEAGQYLLMTIRSHDQFNTTIYGLDDQRGRSRTTGKALRGVKRRIQRIVFAKEAQSTQRLLNELMGAASV